MTRLLLLNHDLKPIISQMDMGWKLPFYVGMEPDMVRRMDKEGLQWTKPFHHLQGFTDSLVGGMRFIA